MTNKKWPDPFPFCMSKQNEVISSIITCMALRSNKFVKAQIVKLSDIGILAAGMEAQIFRVIPSFPV